MNILKRFGLLMVSTVVFAAGACAQPKSGGAPATVEAKLRFVTLDEIPPSLRLVIESAPKVFSPVTPAVGRLSAEYAYSGVPHFFLFDQAEGQITPAKPVAEITLPPTGGTFVVLLAKTQGDLWRAGVLDYGVQAFPGGSVRVSNYSSVPLEVMVNEKRFSVKTGDMGGHKLGFPNEKEPIMLKLTLAYQQNGGEWLTLNNTSQRFFSRQRIQLIGLNTPDEPAPRILKLTDSAPSTAPKPAPGSGR